MCRNFIFLIFSKTCQLSYPELRLGNVDEDYTHEVLSQETVRLSAPDYSAEIPVAFKNVTATYKDRGIMGGTTEITMNGKPTVSVEVADVTLVE